MVKALFGSRDQSLFTRAAAAGHMAAAGEREKVEHYYRGLERNHTPDPGGGRAVRQVWEVGR